MEKNKKIGFEDLTIPMKIAALGGIFYIILFVIGFLEGLLGF